MKRLSILGSTGSIGTQALDVCRNLGYSVVALAAGTNAELLEKQAREFKPKLVALYDEKAAKGLSIALSDTDITVLGGEEGVLKAAEIECDIVLNAVTGIAGLRPTIPAIEAGNDVALANKETLVAGGKRVMDYAKEHDVKILPVDSEHSAIFQCLQAKGDYARIQKLILTASGGPFFGKNAAELEKMKPEDALNHPTWNMGRKVTIDSATMANKGLEIIEAAHLFGVDIDDVEVTVHRESIIHSMVEYIDNAIIAEMGVPDMRLCVQYALTYPERFDSPVKELDFKTLRSLTFGVPDDINFPLLPLARRAFKRGGIVPAVMNGADEMAVELFLRGKLSYLGLSDAVIRVTEEAENIASPTLSDIEEADRWARIRIKEIAEA